MNIRLLLKGFWQPYNNIENAFETQVLRLERVGDRDVTEEELKIIVKALPQLRVREDKEIHLAVCFHHF